MGIRSQVENKSFRYFLYRQKMFDKTLCRIKSSGNMDKDPFYAHHWAEDKKEKCVTNYDNRENLNQGDFAKTSYFIHHMKIGLE